MDARNSRQKRRSFPCDARAPLQHRGGLPAGRVPDQMANGTGCEQTPAHRAPGRTYSPRRRIHLGICVQSELRSVAGRPTGQIPNRVPCSGIRGVCIGGNLTPRHVHGSLSRCRRGCLVILIRCGMHPPIAPRCFLSMSCLPANVGVCRSELLPLCRRATAIPLIPRKSGEPLRPNMLCWRNCRS